MLQKLFNPIDKIIDGITMYRLLMYYLIGLLVAAIILSVVGGLHYDPIALGVSALILVFASWAINGIFAYLFDAPVNPESSIITGLILALIIPPTLSLFGVMFMLAAAGLAIASKYILTIRYKHIFNPAAIAVVLTALGPNQQASWWIGSATMLPLVIIGGVIITRKVRREYMVYSFLAATSVATIIYSFAAGSNAWTALQNMLLSSPVFFLGFVMLTEPYTSPSTKKRQIGYAILVGALLPPQAHILNFYTTPEISLIIGNIFAYLTGNKVKLFPEIQQKIKLTADTLELSFIPNGDISYKPGQYMEWTLPHEKPDARGSRRYFTLSSSPTEKNLAIGVKFYDKSSSYKKALLEMTADNQIVASQVSGNFVMPNDVSQKLAFIAGGIGVTPFRSMVKYLIDTNEARDVHMLYAARTAADFAYKATFEQARAQLGTQIYYIVSDATTMPNEQPYTTVGTISADIIQQTIPDFKERIFYISGTHAMVEAMQQILAEIGVSSNDVKIDFFPGYA